MWSFLTALTKQRADSPAPNNFVEQHTPASHLEWRHGSDLPQAMLFRDYISDDCILGLLVTEKYTFHTLERPWRQNIRNQSCIPAGTYHAHFLPKSASGRYKRCYHLLPVEGRSGILIHNGNLVEHTKGCLIIGKRRGRLKGQTAVLNSKTALTLLASIMNSSDFLLTIVGSQN